MSLGPTLFDDGLDVVGMERTLDQAVHPVGLENLTVVSGLVEGAVAGVEGGGTGGLGLERGAAKVGRGGITSRDIDGDLA